MNCRLPANMLFPLLMRNLCFAFLCLPNPPFTPLLSQVVFTDSLPAPGSKDPSSGLPSPLAGSTLHRRIPAEAVTCVAAGPHRGSQRSQEGSPQSAATAPRAELGPSVGPHPPHQAAEEPGARGRARIQSQRLGCQPTPNSLPDRLLFQAPRRGSPTQPFLMGVGDQIYRNTVPFLPYSLPKKL